MARMRQVRGSMEPDAEPTSAGCRHAHFRSTRHHGAVVGCLPRDVAVRRRLQVMANTREPILQPIPILSLRPTQMTVGMREVEEKRERWRRTQIEKEAGQASGQASDPGGAGAGQAPLRGRPSPSGPLAARRRHQGHSRHRDRRPHHGRPRRVLGRDGQQALGLSLRRQGRTPALQGHSENGGGAQGRSVPQPRRRIAPRRRLRQGHDAVQRIPVGGFFAPQDVAQERGSRISRRRSRRHWRWPRARTRSICPAGAGPRRTISGGYLRWRIVPADSAPAPSLPPSVRCSRRSSRRPASRSREAMARPTITMRQCPTPQAMPSAGREPGAGGTGEPVNLKPRRHAR